MRQIPSSPVTCIDTSDLYDGDREDSISTDHDENFELDVTESILQERKQKYLLCKQPMSSSPLRESARERRRGRLAELARQKKTGTYRADMEQFVMKQEYLRYLRQLEHEASRHGVPEDAIDRLIDEEIDMVPDNNSCGHVTSSPNLSADNTAEALDEDDELLRLIQIQEEYELLMAQEQQELEETLSEFTLQ